MRKNVATVVTRVSQLKILGPGLMRNTRAYELHPFILVYNAAMMVANLSISTYVIYYAFWTGER